MDEQKKLTDGDQPISIDALIKANLMQKKFAEATIEVLEQAKLDKERVEQLQEELRILREREVRRLNQLL